VVEVYPSGGSCRFLVGIGLGMGEDELGVVREVELREISYEQAKLDKR
jgi:hypothetical protein